MAKPRGVNQIGWVVFHKLTKYYGIAQKVVGQTKTHWVLAHYAGSLPDEDGNGVYIRPIKRVAKTRVRFVSDNGKTIVDAGVISRAASWLRKHGTPL